MKKAIVIGCPGSGKSYFSKKLRDKTGFPLYHLDLIYWNADGTFISKPEFREKLSQILNTECWIIDGNYGSTMEMRMDRCDTVFFLDFPVEVCLAGISERKGKRRSDIAWEAPLENDDKEFVEFIKNYNEVNRPQVLELLQKHTGQNIIIFKSREDAEGYLKNM